MTLSQDTISKSALVDRARQMLVAMSERSRFVYALAGAACFEQARAILEQTETLELAQEAHPSVQRYEDEGSNTAVVLFESAPLGVVLLEGHGDAVAPIIKRILDVTGFVAQSKLLAEALQITEVEAAQRALTILAHMCVSWDPDWLDLFLLHLASPDPVVRHNATISASIAAMVASDPEPARALLVEARKREKFPKLAETMSEAMRLLSVEEGDLQHLQALRDANHS